MARASRRGLAGGVALLATIAAGATALIFSGSSAAQAPETLVVVASPQKSSTVFAPPRRSPIGDYFILRFGLREEGGSARVGTEIDDCLIISKFLHQMCDSAFKIRGRGHLITKGIWNPDPMATNVFAITGGTGDFTGAGGTATFEDLGDGRVRVTFEIT